MEVHDLVPCTSHFGPQFGGKEHFVEAMWGLDLYFAETLTWVYDRLMHHLCSLGFNRFFSLLGLQTVKFQIRNPTHPLELNEDSVVYLSLEGIRPMQSRTLDCRQKPGSDQLEQWDLETTLYSIWDPEHHQKNKQQCSSPSGHWWRNLEQKYTYHAKGITKILFVMLFSYDVILTIAYEVWSFQTQVRRGYRALPFPENMHN